MTQAKPLLALIDDLRVDAGERAAYTSDPEGYLASQGWAELDPSELRAALGFARESMPLDVAVTIPDPPAGAEGSLTDVVDEYLGAVASADLDFGADALPHEVELLEPIAMLDDAPTVLQDTEPLTVDLGPDDDVHDDDDDDDEDDPADL